MKLTTTVIKAKGLWLICDSRGICLRVAVTRSQAERIVAQLKKSHQHQQQAQRS